MVQNAVGRKAVTSGGPVTVTVKDPIPCYHLQQGPLEPLLPFPKAHYAQPWYKTVPYWSTRADQSAGSLDRRHAEEAGGVEKLTSLRCSTPFSHKMYLLIRFRKSAPPQNRQLVVNLY